MKTIPLTNSDDLVFVSDEDYKYLNQFTWHTKKSAYCVYVCRSIRIGTRITTLRMHTVVYERMAGQPIPEGIEVHHKNTNKFDNQRYNLEGLTKSEHSRITPR